MKRFAMKVGDWLMPDRSGVARQAPRALLVLEKMLDGYVRMSDGLFHHPSGMRRATREEFSRERSRLEADFRERYRGAVDSELDRLPRPRKRARDSDVSKSVGLGMLPLAAAAVVAAARRPLRRRARVS